MKRNRGLKTLAVMMVFVFIFSQMGLGQTFGNIKVFARDTTPTVAAPIILGATASGDVVTVNWNPVSNATSYTASVNGNEELCTGSSYIKSGMIPSGTFTFKVRATDGTNISDWSSAYNIDGMGVMTPVPVIPTTIPTPAVTPTITVDASSIVEGSENGGVIQVNLANGVFKADGTYNSASVVITPSTLPVGVTEGTVTRESDTQLKILLVGNRTTDYDVNQTISVRVVKELISTASADVSGNGVITSIVEPAPAAPSVTFNFSGATPCRLMGSTAAMEYSIDGGTSYTPVINADVLLNINTITSNNDIRVRLKANGAIPAGNIQTIDILPGATSNVSGNDSANTISGLDSSMEYSVDNGTTWIPFANNTPVLTGNSTIKIRKKAFNLTAPGAIVSLVFTVPIPAAPAVTFSFSGSDGGKLMGSNTLMEYSIDGGNGYNPITTANMLINTNNITAANDIRVRVRTTGLIPSGNITLLDVLAGPASAPSVTADDILNKVTGMTTSMEFSTTGYTWTAYLSTNNLPDLNGGLILHVRVKGNGMTMPGPSKTFMFTGVITPTPAVVTGGGGAPAAATAFPSLPPVSGLSTITPSTALKVSDSVESIRTALLNRSGVTSVKAAENINAAASDIKDLAQIISKTSDSTTSKNLVAQTTALLGAINTAAGDAMDEASVTKILEGLTTAFTNSEALLNVIKDETQKKAVADQLLNLLRMTNQNLNSVNSGETTLKIVENMVNGSTAVKTALQNSQAASSMNSELQSLVQIALKKTGMQAINSVATKDGMKAVIADGSLAELLAKVDAVGNGKTSLEGKLDANGKTSANTMITININGVAGATSVQTDIPANVMSSIKGKGIDKLEVKTGIATVSISANAINTKAITNLSLRVKLVDATKDLTKAQKAAVGNNPVFDFSMDATMKNGKKEKVITFADNVEITIPYTLAEGQDPTKITVFFINEKGILENKAGTYDSVKNEVAFSTGHFSKYFIKENKVAYLDLKGYEEYKVFIESLAAKGLMQASAGKFEPSRNMTKGQLAKLLASISKEKGMPDKTTESNLKDVKKTDVSYLAYASVLKAGIFSSDKNGRFEPESELTREEFAVAVANWAELNRSWSVSENEISSLGYSDKKSIKATSLKAVALLTKYSIMMAKSGADFKPSDSVSRAEASKIIYQLLNTK